LKAFNSTRSTLVAIELEEADGFYTKLKGLIGRDGLEDGTGLWIVGCRAIHTFGMRFPIDVVFLDRELSVKKVVQGVGPFQPMIYCLPAKSVLELPEGTIERAQVRVGDRIKLTD